MKIIKKIKEDKKIYYDNNKEKLYKKSNIYKECNKEKIKKLIKNY